MPAELITRGGGSRCAVLGCGQAWTHIRLAESGFTIGYCADHHRQAERLFGVHPSRKEKAA